MKKAWKILIGILAFFMLAYLVSKAFFDPPTELTVSARFRIPVQRSDRDYPYYLTHDNGHKTVYVHPAEAIGVAEGGHSAPYRPAKMKNGIFRKSFEYGPDSVEGVIRKEDILKVWPDAPLETDWPFSVSFYNTSTGRAFRMFLDISFDAETGRAEAVFYVYDPGYAKPTTDRWEGKPGEKVSVLLEI